jgi:Na+/H+ antiporter NhaA
MLNNEICTGHRRSLKVLVVPVTAAAGGAAVHSIAYHYLHFQSINMFF